MGSLSAPGSLHTNGSGRTKPMNFRVPKYRNLRVAVFTRDDFTCRDCGWRPEQVPAEYDGRRTIADWSSGHRWLEVDHIIPRFVGGPSVLANLATRCASCNCRKGARA